LQKIVAKEWPRINKKLRVRLKQWEIDNKRPFLMNGVQYLKQLMQEDDAAAAQAQQTQTKVLFLYIYYYYCIIIIIIIIVVVLMSKSTKIAHLFHNHNDMISVLLFFVCVL